jgi:hypothetical protein
MSTVEEQVLYTCPRTRASTYYVKIESDRGVSFEEAKALKQDIIEHGKKGGDDLSGDLSGFYRQRYICMYVRVYEHLHALDFTMIIFFMHLVLL